MIKGTLGIFLLVFCINPFYKADPITVFKVVLPDSLEVEINVRLDSLGMPDGYEANVLTPVCEVDKCYDIEIQFSWDLIGRYQYYDTIPGSPLTKLDHEPFVGEDYQKLHEILSNANSVLASYEKEELVKDTRTSSIDGFTGATIREVKESVIGGAVYSCYTLWHIVHGAIIDSLASATKSMFSKNLVGKLVAKDDQEINYYLINHFSDEDFSIYLLEILTTIQEGEGYYAKNAIDKIPTQVLNNQEAQVFFAGQFEKLNYFAQVALLKKLDKSALEDGFKEVLAKQLENRNSYRNELIQKLIEEQP